MTSRFVPSAEAIEDLRFIQKSNRERLLHDCASSRASSRRETDGICMGFAWDLHTRERKRDATISAQ